MHPKTEEFLYLLLWTADSLMHPTFRNLTETYESWAYRKGLMRQLQNLERRQFLESTDTTSQDRLYRLTEAGRIHALGGRDPVERWGRSWDGQWRLVMFDVPVGKDSAREKLRRHLRGRAFGCLQNSVWISPDPVPEERALLAEGEINVGSLILMEARPCAGESDAEIVRQSWDFERIERAYERHCKVLDQFPTAAPQTPEAARSLRRWAERERQTWKEAIELDPLLPEVLLPEGYPGRRAWSHRVEILRHAGQHVLNFKA